MAEGEREVVCRSPRPLNASRPETQNQNDVIPLFVDVCPLRDPLNSSDETARSHGNSVRRD
jgi:hypothetical protein